MKTFTNNDFVWDISGMLVKNEAGRYVDAAKFVNDLCAELAETEELLKNLVVQNARLLVKEAPK